MEPADLEPETSASGGPVLVTSTPLSFTLGSMANPRSF
jgi:hypothetical protein